MSLPRLSSNQNKPLSRREFLKLGGLGTAGLFLTPLTDFQNLVPDQQGRVIDERVSVYELPSFGAKKIKDYWKDMVFPITEVTIGDVEPAYNRIWYRLRQEGYVHSGSIQPVKTQLNQPVSDLPTQGALAEVTVPYTDAHRGASKVFPFGYRYYYETTHWIIGLVYNQQG